MILFYLTILRCHIIYELKVKSGIGYFDNIGHETRLNLFAITLTRRKSHMLPAICLIENVKIAVLCRLYGIFSLQRVL